jgi:TonB family protein
MSAHAADAVKIGCTMSTTFLGAISADRVTDRVINRVIDGRFPLLQRLGGTEWSSAHLTVLDDGRAQRAAIKIFSYKFVDERATLARWDVARTLSHPHLMPLFHAGRCAINGEDLLYVVTEYADETLSQLLPDRPLSPREAREMLGPILGALAYLHNRCLTHGHLRPTNIMVIDDQVKLSPDFGWRSRARSIYDAPETGTLYAAPAADIWSLGILLVEALTQQPPAWDRSHGTVPEIPSDIPEPFFTICRECLRTNPAQRCTLAGIKARLDSSHDEEPAVRLAVEPSVAIVHRPANQTLPDIPAKIIAAVHGHFKVQIRVAVDPEGSVSQASIGSPGPSSYFANQALRAAGNWKFAPAKVNGRAVPSAWLLLFQFGQSQSSVTQSEESP